MTSPRGFHQPRKFAVPQAATAGGACYCLVAFTAQDAEMQIPGFACDKAGVTRLTSVNQWTVDRCKIAMQRNPA